ncbi:unnamed protein product, partial [Rotaria magnacalcarata]
RQNVLRFIITTCSGLSSECIKVYHRNVFRLIVNVLRFIITMCLGT